MKIVSLRAENIKRLSAVEIKPDGSVVEITGKNKQGKQQPTSEPVLTPHGWKMIGDIKVGEYVIGGDGRPTKVMGVYPQSERTTYRLIASDGTETRCGPDHLWTVHRWDEANGSKTRITETISTAAIIAKGLHRNGGKARRWALPVAGPIEFADTGADLPIDPYTLGIILGDGHIEPTGYVTITSWDEEILAAVAPAECWRGEHEIGTSFWSRPLRHVGLSGRRSWEKFIPQAYMQASVADRFDLLFGLMDSDGTAEASWASFCSTSGQLALDIVALARSLGCVCKMRAPATKKYTYNGEPREGRIAYVVQIKSTAAPFKVQRKVDSWSPSDRRGEWLRFIDTIEKVADEDSVCIQVEASDGLYVTNGFLVTHNTSVLDSIWWALTGTSNVQKSPIRAGCEKAFIQLDLGKLQVTRKFAEKEGGHTTTLEVRDADGNKFQGGQSILDAIYGELTFDPLNFTRMKAKDQFDTLKSFVPGVDFEAIDKANDDDFKARTALNVKAKELRAQAAGIVLLDSIGDRIDETALVGQLEKAGEHNADIQARAGRRDAAIQQIATLKAAATEKAARAILVRKEADELDASATADNTTAEEIQKKLNEAGELPAPIDTSAVREKIELARTANAAVDSAGRAKADHDRITAEADKVEAEALALTSARDARTKAKAEAVAAAKIPVDGISFGDGAILLNGVPFDQASDAEQLAASVGIAAAMNPRLRIIRVRDGSRLDDESMKMLGEMATKADMQVWIETVESGRDGAIVMEDGHVKGAATLQAAE